MRKQFPASVTTQRNQTDSFQFSRCAEQLAAKFEHNTIKQRSPFANGGAPVRRRPKIAFDSGKFIRIEISKYG